MFLMGLLLTLAVPRFGLIGEEEQLRSAARSLAAQAVEANSQAVTESQPWFLYLDLDRARSWVSQTGPDDTSAETPAERAYTLPSKIKFRDVNHAEKGLVRKGLVAFAFWASGGNEPGAVHLSGPDNREMTIFLRPYLGRTEIYNGYLREEVE